MSKEKINKTKVNQQQKSWVDYAFWILIAATVICYLPILQLNLVMLDDTIFINDKHQFMKELSNIPAAFTQGVFSEKDIYYRPLLIVYFILIHPFTSPNSITAFHFASLLLHVLNVTLVFRLLMKLISDKQKSFWLALFFAIHPSLTMAVAWIPGANDLLLTTFALLYFISLIKLTEEFSLQQLLLNFLFLMCALLTKETAAFLPIGAMILLIYQNKLSSFKKNIPLFFGVQAIAWIAWFFARKNVLTPDAATLINSDMLSLMMFRLTGMLQYFGKCFLPFNLNVFPTIEATSNIWGTLAVVVAGIFLWLNKERNHKKILLSLSWFVLFLLPIFFVPKNISDQLFEHRLYLPMIGILLLLNETFLFHQHAMKNAKAIIAAGMVVIFAGLIFSYTKTFADPIVFWKNAVESSPQSAYANKLYGIQIIQMKTEDDPLPYFKEAYRLDSTERYTNFFLAKLQYINQNKWSEAKPLLEKEITINPKYMDAYANLAQCCVEMKDYACAEKNLLKFLELNPKEQMISNNLLLIYKEQKKFAEGKKFADKMKAEGMDVNEEVYRALTDSLVVQ